MPENRSLLLKLISDYGHNGSYSLLQDILEGFYSIKMASHVKSLKIPLDVAVEVAKQLFHVIEGNKRCQKYMAWLCLSMLCYRDTNNCAFEFMERIAKLNIFSQIPVAVSGLAQNHQSEALSCLSFVTTFALSEESKRNILFGTEGVIQSILKALDTKLDQLYDNVRTMLIDTVTLILGDCSNPLTIYAEQFFRSDGFRILHEVLKSALDWAQATVTRRPLDEEESGLLRSVAVAMCSLYGSSVQLFVPVVSSMHEGLYTLDLSDIEQTTSVMCGLLVFPTCLEEMYHEAAIRAAVQFWEYMYFYHIEFLEFALLYSEEMPLAPEASGVPFILLFLRAIHDEQLMHLQELLARVEDFYSPFPYVQALVDQERSSQVPLDPALAPYREVCAMVGCMHRGNTNVRFLNCSRCKKVCYCGKEHQAQHWPEHKQTCEK